MGLKKPANIKFGGPTIEGEIQKKGLIGGGFDGGVDSGGSGAIADLGENAV